MRSEWEMRDLLVRELRQVSAPAGLWIRMNAVLEQPEGRSAAVHPAWFLAAALGLLICVTPFVHGRRELDLGSYLAPVQAASPGTSASAIAQAPPHFKDVRSPGAANSVAGFQVTTQREARVGGETVRQVILTAASGAVALFISSPKVRLDAGANRWVDARVDGVACKRLNCPRVRTAQFPCLQQTCVLICKACSDQALSALMSGVADIR